MKFETNMSRRAILRDASKILEEVNANAEGTIEGKAIRLAQEILLLAASNEPKSVEQLDVGREIFGDLNLNPTCGGIDGIEFKGDF